MPAQYDAIKQSFMKKGMDEADAKTSASKTFIANGKGGDRSSRAKSLHKDKPKGRKRPVSFGKPFGKNDKY